MKEFAWSDPDTRCSMRPLGRFVRSALDSFLPALGITLCMEYSDNNHGVWFNQEKGFIRKPSREPAADALIDDGILQRITKDRIEETIDRPDEI
jgi:hypothetical protein